MADLDEYGIDLETLRRMYREWRDGTPKSTLERTYLGRPGSHGKLFSSLVRQHLGVETEHRHPLVEENRRLAAENMRLRELLRGHGISVPHDFGETDAG